MLVELIRFIKGFVKISVSGYSTERFINACKHRNIRLWGILSKNGCYEMYTTIHGFKKIKPIIRKTGTKVMIIERFGLPFLLFKYRKRKIFFIFTCLCVIQIYMMSQFIWGIEIDGNFSETDEMITEYLDEQNIKQGILRKKVDCTKIASSIREGFDDIIWVSVFVEGSKMYIHVKENDMVNKEENTITVDSSCTDIVANMDCKIAHIITRNGVPRVKEGDNVKKGDILVSGIVEIVNDNKEIIGYQKKNAQASILGICQIDYNDLCLSEYEEKEYQDKTSKNIYIKIGDYLLRIGKKKTDTEQWESMFQELQLKFGKNFELPIWIGLKTTKSYHLSKKNYSQQEMEYILKRHIEETCERLEKKGVEIIENSVKIYTECNYAQAKGTLLILCEVGEITNGNY